MPRKLLDFKEPIPELNFEPSPVSQETKLNWHQTQNQEELDRIFDDIERRMMPHHFFQI